MNNLINKALISEIALRLADIQYKDFHKNIYEQALLRADREVAKKYQVINKIYQSEIETETEVILNLPNFKAEYFVSCEEQTLRKVTHKIENLMENCYYLEMLDGSLRFAYKKTNLFATTEEEFNELQDVLLTTTNETESTSTNKITILYTIIPDKELYTTNDYIISDIYDEERIIFSMRYLCQIGIATYNGDKKQKYFDILKMISDNNDFDKKLVKDNAWITIKPFTYL